MKTLTEELVEHEQRCASGKIALAKKHAVLDQMASLFLGYHEPSVHCSQRFLHFHGTPFDSIRSGRNPDKALLAILLAAYTPLPKMMVRNGRIVSVLLREEYAGIGVVEPIFPVTVRIGRIYNSADFEWFACVGADVWRFSVRIPYYSTSIGKLGHYYDNYNGQSIYRSSSFDSDDFTKGSRLARGSGDFEVYWYEGKFDMPSLLSKLK